MAKDLAYQTLLEIVACICECGHTDSEHYTNAKFRPTNCAECECKRFKVAFKLEPTKAKGKKHAPAKA